MTEFSISDEEIGGADGMGTYVQTDEFKKLNIGCALDESMPGPSEMFFLHYADRTKLCECYNKCGSSQQSQTKGGPKQNN